MGMACVRLIASVAAITLSGASAAQVSADAWPARTVTIIVPLAAGAATDIEARLYAQKLTENLGKPFIVDFKPGAGSTIGTAYVARAAPDGHTLLTMAPTFTLAPLAYPSLPYDPDKDIVPVSLVSKRPSIFLVHPSLPVKSVTEYIAYAKANPGKLNVGTAGAGSLAELGWGWFNSITGIKVTVVNYKGGGPATLALLSGEVHAALGGISLLLPQIKTGKLRLIGISTPERSKILPDVPTMAEQGAPGFSYAQWIGIGAPGGTPVSIVNKVQTEFARAARTPEIVQKLEEDGTVIIASTPEQFRQIITEETARWRRVARDTGTRLAQ